MFLYKYLFNYICNVAPSISMLGTDMSHAGADTENRRTEGGILGAVISTTIASPNELGLRGGHEQPFPTHQSKAERGSSANSNNQVKPGSLGGGKIGRPMFSKRAE